MEISNQYQTAAYDDNRFCTYFTYSVSDSYLWVANCTSVAALVILVVFFRPKYKRLAAERKEKLQSKAITTVDGILSTKL